MHNSKNIDNMHQKAEVKEVSRNFTPTITLFKDNCRIIMPVINSKDWQNQGWKTDEELKKEAEARIEQAKINNKK